MEGGKVEASAVLVGSRRGTKWDQPGKKDRSEEAVGERWLRSVFDTEDYF